MLSISQSALDEIETDFSRARNEAECSFAKHELSDDTLNRLGSFY